MPFLAHVGELRQRLLRSLMVFVAAFFIATPFADWGYEYLRQPLIVATHDTAVKPTFIYTTPFEVFVAFMKIALMMALLITLPFILSQVWGFIAPALKRREKRWFWPFITVTTSFFLAGVAFAYKVALPWSYRFFIGYAPSSILPQLRVSDYLTSTLQMLLTFGLLFETPILISLLIYLRVLSTKTLLQQWRMVVVGIAIIAAIMTPADVISMIILAVPLLLLFVASIGFGLLIERYRKTTN